MYLLYLGFLFLRVLINLSSKAIKYKLQKTASQVPLKKSTQTVPRNNTHELYDKHHKTLVKLIFVQHN